MSHGVSFINIGIILLDILLLWACWAVDKHLKFLADETQQTDAHYATHLRCRSYSGCDGSDEAQSIEMEPHFAHAA